jgi:hypothetical protein
MPKSKEEIMEYNEVVEWVKKAAAAGKITEDDKNFVLKAMSDGFYKDIEIGEEDPRRERLDALSEIITDID